MEEVCAEIFITATAPACCVPFPAARKGRGARGAPHGPNAAGSRTEAAPCSTAPARGARISCAGQAQSGGGEPQDRDQRSLLRPHRGNITPRYVSARIPAPPQRRIMPHYAGPPAHRGFRDAARNVVGLPRFAVDGKRKRPECGNGAGSEVASLGFHQRAAGSRAGRRGQRRVMAVGGARLAYCRRP